MMACYVALVDLSPAQFQSVSELFRRYGSSLGDAGSTHGAGTARGGDPKAHLAYFNGEVGRTRADAMEGYYWELSSSNFQKLVDWVIDGDHYTRVRNVGVRGGNLPQLRKPDNLAQVEEFLGHCKSVYGESNPCKFEYYPRYM